MAFQEVPHTTQITCHGAFVSGIETVTNFYWYDNSDPTINQAFVDGLADSLDTIVDASGIESHIVSSYSWDRIVATDLRVEGGNQVTSTHEVLVGTSGGDTMPPQTSGLISWRSTFRTRNGRGRTFLTGFDEGSNNGTMTTACHTAIQSFADALIAALKDTGRNMAIVSRFSGTELVPRGGGQLIRVPKRIDGPASTYEVTTALVDTIWRSQRRRELR